MLAVEVVVLLPLREEVGRRRHLPVAAGRMAEREGTRGKSEDLASNFLIPSVGV